MIVRYVFVAFLLLSVPVRADMYPDGSNAKLPTTGTVAAAVCQTAAGKLLAAVGGCGLDVRQFGAVGNGIADDAPAFRAACAASAQSGQTVVVPRGLYYLQSLDPSGLGVVVMGTSIGGSHLAACHMTGAVSADYPDTCVTSSPYLKLGAGLNRPLVYIKKNTESPLWQNLCLDGNRAAQTGWAGGPSGKLYAVQAEDDTALEIDASIRMDRMVVMGGYNGNVYIGSYRGGSWFHDTWLMYSGQTTADNALFLNGFDGAFQGLGVGNNAGAGIMVAEGSQYQFTDGAIWQNSGPGLRVNGGLVQYMVMSGTNIQQNKQEGLRVLNVAPAGGTAVLGHLFSNLTFDGNSGQATGTYSDVYLEATQTHDRFVNIAFGGNVLTSGTIPKYNIEIAGSAATLVSNVSLGSGTPNTLGFSNNIAAIAGNAPVARTWTPVMAGSSTAGTFAPTVQSGTWSINQNFVTANFSLTGTLAGAAGSMQVTGLPLFTGGTVNQNGHCYLTKVTGWTTAGGAFTWLAGLIVPSSTAMYVTKNGSALGGNLAATTEFSGSIDLYGTCVYSVTPFPVL